MCGFVFSYFNKNKQKLSIGTRIERKMFQEICIFFLDIFVYLSLMIRLTVYGHKSASILEWLTDQDNDEEIDKIRAEFGGTLVIPKDNPDVIELWRICYDACVKPIEVIPIKEVN